MLKNRDKWLLFCSSYLPLYIFIIIQEYNFFEKLTLNVILYIKSSKNFDKSITISEWLFFTFIIVLLLLSILTILIFLFSSSNKRFSVGGQFEKSGDSILGYIVTYLIPMLSIDIKDKGSLIVNALLFFFLGFIYVTQDLIYLNPILSIFGYKFYFNDNKVILTKLSLEKLKEYEENGIMVKGNRLGSDIFIYRKVLEQNLKSKF